MIRSLRSRRCTGLGADEFRESQRSLVSALPAPGRRSTGARNEVSFVPASDERAPARSGSAGTEATASGGNPAGPSDAADPSASALEDMVLEEGSPARPLPCG